MKLKESIQMLNLTGQSVWCDNLSKNLISSGELQKLIVNLVSGLTSNPSIFKKAIADSNDYDQDIKRLISQSSNKNLTVDEVTEMLMIEDVRNAAMLFMPVYESTNCLDGYVSIEVSPTLAHDTKGTIEAAKRIWEELSAQNVMIKIPATKEGIPAIKAVLEEGINVNITLIFSTEVYKAVVNAFFEGLESRANKGLPISNIASVASFFVSRVDTIVDKQLEKLASASKTKEMQGKFGILNSIEAYKMFITEFKSPRFNALRQKGAQIQRVLWASTGVKNPAYDPLYYVKALAAENTVNTVPPQVLTALENDLPVGKINLTDDNTGYFNELSTLGVNLKELLIQLEVEGVKLFADAYAELVTAVDKKMRI